MPLQTMTSLVVMTMTVAMWLLPAAGDVSGGMDHATNTTLTHDAVTEAPGNSSVKQLVYYRVSRLTFASLLVALCEMLDPDRLRCTVPGLNGFYHQFGQLVSNVNSLIEERLHSVPWFIQLP